MKTTQKRLVKAITLAMMTSVSGVTLSQPLDLSLLGSQGVRFDGGASGDLAGVSVSGAGDVNGDGIPDVVVGASGVNESRGEAYVVFGSTESDIIDLGNLGSGGFSIAAPPPSGFASDFAAASVSGAGDVNGDGLDDIVVGVPFRTPSGRAVVIFGKKDSDPVDIHNIGTDGFLIGGGQFAGRLGNSVSGAGDVNGDGLDDIIVGEPYSRFTPPNGPVLSSAGNAYIIFGKDDSRMVDVSDLGEDGTTIMGVNSNATVGLKVSGVGDVNGDGLDDVAVAARRAGKTYVIFGQEVANTVRTDAVGLKGYVIDSENPTGVAGAGDVNGDGFADIAIGSLYASGDAGEGYVVFGKPDVDPVSVANLGNGGFTITALSGFLGATISGAGDVNGDGLADVIIGAPRGQYNTPFITGMAYLVYGKTDNTEVDLATPDPGHRYIIGAAMDDGAGGFVSGAGDVNGDGLPEVLVGASEADPAGGDLSAGQAYLIYSSTMQQPPSAFYQRWTGPDDTPRMAIGVSGDRSNHTTPDSRVWIDFINGQGFLTPESLQSVVLYREGTPLPNAGVDMYWLINTSRRDYSNVTVTFKYLENELLTSNEADLQLFYSSDVDGPYTQVAVTRDTVKNTLSARVNDLGYFFIGGGVRPDPLFSDGFE